MLFPVKNVLTRCVLCGLAMSILEKDMLMLSRLPIMCNYRDNIVIEIICPYYRDIVFLLSPRPNTNISRYTVMFTLLSLNIVWAIIKIRLVESHNIYNKYILLTL